MKKIYSDYADYPRNYLIQKIAQTEQQLSSDEIKKELKALYYRRYVNLLDVLSKKIKELNF